MGYKIKVSENGIQLKEAVYIADGYMPKEAVGERMTDIEEIEGGNIIELPQHGAISLGEEPLPITAPVEIRGNHTVLKGNNGVGIVIMASDVCLDAVDMDFFKNMIVIRANGNEISDIRIQNCNFKGFTSCCITTGSDQSNSVIKNVTVNSCIFEGTPERMEEGKYTYLDSAVGVMIMASTGNEKEALVENCVLDGMKVHNCTFRGRHRNVINVMPATNLAYADGKHVCRGNVVRNLSFINNHMTGAYDATVNFMGGFTGCEDSTIENVEVAYNYLVYNIWGVYICGPEPTMGPSASGTARNFHIHDNRLYLRAGGAGEDSAALAIQCGRVDYARDGYARNGRVEDITYERNEIHATQHGVFINAADSMIDVEGGDMTDNIVDGVKIIDNKFYEVDDVITIYGVQAEGRRRDVRIGVPPRTQDWIPLPEQDDFVSQKAENNIVRNVDIRGNYATGYKFKYKMAGVKAGGHAVLTGNRVENITMSENVFENGEGHILVEDEILWDFTKGSDNHVTKEYRK